MQVLKLSHAAEQHFDYRTHHETLMGEAYEVRQRQRSGSSSSSEVAAVETG